MEMFGKRYSSWEKPYYVTFLAPSLCHCSYIIQIRKYFDENVVKASSLNEFFHFVHKHTVNFHRILKWDLQSD
jgi:hypothetical protein